MKELYLVNYCSNGCEPFKSITRLKKKKAFEVAKELSASNCGTAFRRFGEDFKGYYSHRIRTEEWLYNQFLSLGGKPKTKHPVYFVVGGSDYLNKWFGEGKVTKLLIDIVNSQDISFTFGDSMGMMDKQERKEPIMKETLFELIETYDNDINLFINDMRKKYYYIEAQIWNDKYLLNLHNK